MSVDVIMWHQAVLPSTVIYLTVQRHVRAQLPAMPLTTSTAHSVRDPYEAAVGLDIVWCYRVRYHLCVLLLT